MLPPPIRTLAGKWLLAAFLLLAAGIGALWYSALSAYEAAVLRERGRELQAIAELKIEFIRFWVAERRSDSVVQAERLLMARALTPDTGRAGSYGTSEVLGQIEAIRQAYNYEAVMLQDLEGNIRLGAGPSATIEYAGAGGAAADAIKNGRTVFSRAYHATSGNGRHADIDIATPVIDKEQPGSHVVGALVFHLDPREHLDPFLRQWPAPSESGETFLFERSDQEIVFLSALRHADSLTMRSRVDDPALPAALAARGQQGVVEGLDYRGLPVLAAVGQVPGMPWFVVAKLDRTEVLAPVRREALWSGALSALLVLALGLAMLSWHRRGQSELALAQQAAVQAALSASEARFRKLIENAWDLLVLFDRNMRIVYASPSVEQQLGDKMLGESIARGTALVHPEDVDRVEAARIQALAHPGAPQRFEHRLKGRYDHWMTVEASFTNHFDDPDIGALVYAGRDITERKWAEQALRDSEERYRFLFRLSPDAVFLHRNGVIFQTNDAAVRLFGAGSENALIGRHWRELVAPERWPSVEQRIALLENGEQAYLQPAEQRYRSDDGRAIEVEATGARIVVDGRPAIMSVVRDITERRRAEAALRESEARLQAIIEHAPLGIAIVSAKGRYVMVNPAQCRMLGYSEAELLGRSFRDFTQADDADLNEKMALEMLEGRLDHFSLEKRYVRKDGQQIWVVLSVGAVRDEGGALRYFIGLLQDITERKRMEQALRESEARYRFLFEGSPLPMWVFDKETLAFLEVNRAAVEQYGYAREEFLSRSVRDIRPTEDVAALEKAIRLADPSQGGIWTHRRKDGSLLKAAIWYQDTNFFGRNGRLVLAENVTARVEAELALRESENTLRIFLDTIPGRAIVMDTKGMVHYANRLATESLGVKLEQMIGANAFSFLPADVAARRLAIAEQAMLENRTIRFEDIRDGRDIESFFCPIPDSRGVVFRLAVLAFDITERKQAEERRLEYARQQRDTLVREVHHRIKNHLQGLAGLLRQHMAQPALKPVLEEVVAQINAISVVHGLQGRERGDTSLRSLATEIASFLGSITGSRIALNCPAHACLWAVAEAEAVPLALVLNELLTNALRHGMDKARVSLSMECDGMRAQLIIRNPGRLDAGLDFAHGKGLGTGLGLIRSLLPQQGIVLGLENAEDGWVEARLELGPPVLLPTAQVVSLR